MSVFMYVCNVCILTRNEYAGMYMYVGMYVSMYVYAREMKTQLRNFEIVNTKPTLFS